MPMSVAAAVRCIPRVAVWGVLPLLALLYLPALFVTGTEAASCAVALAVFSLCGVTVVGWLRQGVPGGWGVSLSEAGVGLALVWLFVADVRAGTLSWVAWMPLLAGAGLFVALRREWTARPPAALWMAGGLAVASVAEWLWAAAQVAGWLPVAGGVFRVTGGFDNPAALSVAALVGVPGAWAAGTVLPRRWRGVLWATVTVGGLVLCLWAGARAGLLALGAAWGVLAVRCAGARWRRGFVIVLVVGLIGAAVWAALAFKSASTAGRWTIYRVTASLVADAPLFGRGTSGFQRDYMPCQAEWLTRQGTPRERWLAGQVRHPLSEYLSAAVAGGLSLLLLVCAGLGGALHRGWRGGRTDAGWLALLTGLGVLALFSYPFFYALGRLTAVASAAWLFRGERAWRPSALRLGVGARRAVCGVAATLSAAGFCASAVRVADALRWKQSALRALNGVGAAVLPDYERLARRLSDDGAFLYNYAAELHYAGRYAQSNSVWHRCVRFRRDYDTEFLAAANALALRRPAAAERHLLTASAMVPVRFAPLYVLLTEVYLPRADTVRALDLARRLAAKPVKISSPDVRAMKTRAAAIAQEPEMGGENGKSKSSLELSRQNQ